MHRKSSIDRLIARSSLGTEAAVALRRRTPELVTAEILARSGSRGKTPSPDPMVKQDSANDAEKTSSMSGKNHHVVPHNGQWAVRTEGSSRPSSTHKTQREAIDTAREKSRAQRSELLIHGKDGKIRAKDSHGKDRFPPKG